MHNRIRACRFSAPHSALVRRDGHYAALHATQRCLQLCTRRACNGLSDAYLLYCCHSSPPLYPQSAESRELSILVSLVVGALQRNEVTTNARSCARTPWETVCVDQLGLAALLSALRPAHTSALQNEHSFCRMGHAATIAQGCSIAPVMLTVCCRVIGECGRLSGAAVSASLVSRTRALRYSAECLQNESCVADAPAHAGGYQ